MAHPRKLRQGPAISLTAGQNQFKFPIAFDLFDGDEALQTAQRLLLGSSVLLGFPDWTVPAGKLEKMTDEQGRAWLIATFPATQPSCFARIEVVAP